MAGPTPTPIGGGMFVRTAFPAQRDKGKNVVMYFYSSELRYTGTRPSLAGQSVENGSRAGQMDANWLYLQQRLSSVLTLLPL
jgi:hypothetical protein